MVLLGLSNDHGHAGVPLEAGGLGPEPVFAKVKAVVGGKGDDGVFPQAETVSSASTRYMGIHITDGGIVTVA